MKDKLEELIRDTIVDLSPNLLDDDQPDAFIDPKHRDEAIDFLVTYLQDMREL